MKAEGRAGGWLSQLLGESFPQLGGVYVSVPGNLMQSTHSTHLIQIKLTGVGPLKLLFLSAQSNVLQYFGNF